MNRKIKKHIHTENRCNLNLTEHSTRKPERIIEGAERNGVEQICVNRKLA